jgi:hypothetical protein
MEIELYNYLDRLDELAQEESELPAECEFCGRFEPCHEVFGCTFCIDSATCHFWYSATKKKCYSLDVDLTPKHQHTLNLLTQVNLTRLPDDWREWVTRQLEIHKGEL